VIAGRGDQQREIRERRAGAEPLAHQALVAPVPGQRGPHRSRGALGQHQIRVAGRGERRELHHLRRSGIGGRDAHRGALAERSASGEQREQCLQRVC
jgi:hypothetical protein